MTCHYRLALLDARNKIFLSTGCCAEIQSCQTQNAPECAILQLKFQNIFADVAPGSPCWGGVKAPDSTPSALRCFAPLAPRFGPSVPSIVRLCAVLNFCCEKPCFTPTGIHFYRLFDGMLCERVSYQSMLERVACIVVQR